MAWRTIRIRDRENLPVPEIVATLVQQGEDACGFSSDEMGEVEVLVYNLVVSELRLDDWDGTGNGGPYAFQTLRLKGGPTEYDVTLEEAE